MRTSPSQTDSSDIDHFASDPLLHGPLDFFHPPGLNNLIGQAHSTRSISGISCLAFPPFGCAGEDLSPHEFNPVLSTMDLFVDGRFSMTLGEPEPKVEFTWFPDRIVRKSVIKGIHFKTTTSLVEGHRGVGEIVEMRNPVNEPVSIKVASSIRADVTRKDESWPHACPSDFGPCQRVVNASPCICLSSLFCLGSFKAVTVQKPENSHAKTI